MSNGRSVPEGPGGPPLVSSPMMSRRHWARLVAAVGGVAGLIVAAVVVLGPLAAPRWNDAELATLASLSIRSLPEVPVDPSNRWADDARAAALGAQLFADPRFSATESISCASCHRAQLSFTDGLRLARGVGQVPRKTMTIVGTAYSRWLFWDGRKDSLWAQALGPLESQVEHGATRTLYALLIAEHYAPEYEAVFGPLPDFSDARRFPPHAGPNGDESAVAAWAAMTRDDQRAVTEVFVNMGKAIAAFERRLSPTEARFDRYVDSLLAGDSTGGGVLTDDEVAGLELFIGRAGCVTCHSGPLFTNGEFHNTGVPQEAGRDDTGRAAGAHAVLEDEFNCLSPWSDAGPHDCGHLEFLRVDDHALAGAFKVPTLRNVELAAPFMDAGQFASLSEVLRHYNTAPEATVGHSELRPLDLAQHELAQLETFLRTLTGPAEMPDFPSTVTDSSSVSERSKP